MVNLPPDRSQDWKSRLLELALRGLPLPLMVLNGWVLLLLLNYFRDIITIIDQLIENGIAPQLIGGFTGLSPVWILLPLLIGAKVAGILGLIGAVPIASSIRDLLVFTAPKRMDDTGLPQG